MPDQLDPGLVDEPDDDGRLRRARLLLDARAELLDRAVGGQVDRLRQPQPEQLVELVPQHGVHLGVRAGQLQPVRVAHAALLGERHRGEQQRRLHGRRRVVLHVVPAQERDDEPQLVAPVLGPVAAGRRDERVQRGGRVGGVVPADQRADVDDLAVDQPGGGRAAPGEQLRRAHVPHVQDQRHRRLGQVDGPPGGPEVQERVASRGVEQPVAQVLQDRGPTVGAVGSGAEHALEVEVLRLVAVRLQARDDVREVLRATPAVGRDHRARDRGQHRVQTGLEGEQVVAPLLQQVGVVLVGQVQAAHQRDEQLAEARDVGELVVVADQVLPPLPAGHDADRVRLGPPDGPRGGVLDGPAVLDVDRGRHLGGRDHGTVAHRRAGGRHVDRDRSAVDVVQRREAAQRRHPAGLVQRRHGPEQGQQQAQHVVRRQPAAAVRLGDEVPDHPATSASARASTAAVARAPRSSSVCTSATSSVPSPTRRATATTAARSSTAPSSSAVAKSRSTAAR